MSSSPAKFPSTVDSEARFGGENFAVNGTIRVDCKNGPTLENGYVTGDTISTLIYAIEWDVVNQPFLKDIKQLPDTKQPPNKILRCWQGWLVANIKVTVRIGVRIGDTTLGYTRTKTQLYGGMWTRCAICDCESKN